MARSPLALPGWTGGHLSLGALILFLGFPTPSLAAIDISLNRSNFVQGQASEISVDGLVTGSDTITGCLAMLRYDPSKVTISATRAATGGWTPQGVNLDNPGVYNVVMTNSSDPGHTTSGPVFYFTVTPANASVNINDCTVLRLVGGPDGSNVANGSFDAFYSTQPCDYLNGDVPDGGGGALDKTGAIDRTGSTGGSDGPTELVGECAPEIGMIIQSLKYAAGLDAVTWETNVADYDTNGDGQITLVDVLRALRSPCPPVISAAPYTFDPATATGCPYPSILITFDYTLNVPVQFEVQRKVAESADWLTVGTVQGLIGTHSYEWANLFLTGSKQYMYRARTVLDGGTPIAFGGPYSPTASAITNGDPDWSDVMGPLEVTDPRSWVPECVGAYAEDESDLDPPPTSNYTMWWRTGVYDDETGNVSTIPFDPLQWAPPAGSSETGSVPESDPPVSNGFIHDGREKAPIVAPPYNAVCKIVVRYRDGTWGHGTGTLIGAKRFVLTAGHVVVRRIRGRADYPPEVWVIPGAYNDPSNSYLQNGAPYNRCGQFSRAGIAHVEKRWYFNRYNEKFDQRNDIAVLKLGGGTYLAQLYTMPVVGYASPEQNIGKPFTMAGYPFNDDNSGGWTMYSGEGRTHSWYGSERRIVKTDLDANNGDSGSGLWNSERYGYDTIFAVLTMKGPRAGQTSSDSEAVVINPEVGTWISQLLGQ